MAWKAACVSPWVGLDGGKRFEWANKTSPNSFIATIVVMVALALIAISKFILIQPGWGGNHFKARHARWDV